MDTFHQSGIRRRHIVIVAAMILTWIFVLLRTYQDDFKTTRLLLRLAKGNRTSVLMAYYGRYLRIFDDANGKRMIGIQNGLSPKEIGLTIPM